MEFDDDGDWVVYENFVNLSHVSFDLNLSVDDPPER